MQFPPASGGLPRVLLSSSSAKSTWVMVVGDEQLPRAGWSFSSGWLVVSTHIFNHPKLKVEHQKYKWTPPLSKESWLAPHAHVIHRFQTLRRPQTPQPPEPSAARFPKPRGSSLLRSPERDRSSPARRRWPWKALPPEQRSAVQRWWLGVRPPRSGKDRGGFDSCQ